MNHPAVRVAAAAAFLAVWATPIALDATDTEGISTQPPWDIILLVGVYGGVGVAAGFLTRFPALLLPLVLLVAVVPLDDGGGDITYEGAVGIAAVFVAYPTILGGLLARVVVDRLRNRHSAVGAAAQ